MPVRKSPAETPGSELLPGSEEIPNKLYFRIGEVSRLAGVKPYVLRYWESEFAHLRPKKSGSNQRLYPRKEVEYILEIKRLLYDKRYTIEGARKFLESKGKSAVVEKPAARAKAAPPAAQQGALFPLADGIPRESWNQIRDELEALHQILK